MCSLVKNVDIHLPEQSLGSNLIDIKNGVCIKEEIIISSDDSISFEQLSFSDIFDNITRNELVSHAPVKSKDATGKEQKENESKFRNPRKRVHNAKTQNKFAPPRNPDITEAILLYCASCDETSRKIFRKRNEDHCKKCGAEWLFRCSKCEKTYTKRNTTYRHLKYECRREPGFGCSQCEYRTTRVTYLRRHLREVHVALDQIKFHKCCRCTRAYKNRRDLIKHERRCGIAPYLRCKQCKYETNDERYLMLHMQKTHAELKPEDYYVCPTCGARFKHRYYLQSHLTERCKKKRKVLCAHCDFKTCAKPRLIIHLRKKHFDIL